jgi:hypothetical protein
MFSISKLNNYYVPFSLDGSIPEIIIRKIRQSNNSIITFIAHPKLFSQVSEKTIKLLLEKNFRFHTITHILKMKSNG